MYVQSLTSLSTYVIYDPDMAEVRAAARLRSVLDVPLGLLLAGLAVWTLLRGGFQPADATVFLDMAKTWPAADTVVRRRGRERWLWAGLLLAPAVPTVVAWDPTRVFAILRGRCSCSRCCGRPTTRTRSGSGGR